MDLSHLRGKYDKLNCINIIGQRQIESVLSELSHDNLEILAKANIKFVSDIALLKISIKQ